MYRKIKLFYAKVPNMGDLLNPIIFNDLFSVKTKRSPLYSSEVIAIGSGLNALFKSNTKIGMVKQYLLKQLSDQFHVWGTGFLIKPEENSDFFRNDVTFHSVRGNLSKNYLDKIFKNKFDIKTGDAGLLISNLFDKKIEKKYELGIIPHFREQNEKEFFKLEENFSKSKIIDLRDNPYDVVKEIASCELVVSSSLHGLVVADSFGIPNLHIVVSSRLKGDGFKFRDYYSAFNINHNYIKLSGTMVYLKNYIIDNYKLNKKIIEEKKKEIYSCFPFM